MPEGRRSGAPIVILSAVFGSALAGLTPIFVKSSELGAIGTACWRLGASLPILMLGLWIWRKANGGSSANAPLLILDRTTLKLGLLYAVDVTLWHLAFANTSIANAAFLGNLAPVFVLLFQLARGEKRALIQDLVAVGTGVFGMSVLLGFGSDLSFANTLGNLCAIGASIAFSAFLLVAGNSLRGQSEPGKYAGLTFVALPPIVLATFIFEHGQFVPRDIDGVLTLVVYAVVVHCVAFLALFLATSALGALGTAILNLAQPISATVLGIAVAKQALGGSELWGAICVGLAILIASMGRRSDESEPVI